MLKSKKNEKGPTIISRPLQPKTPQGAIGTRLQFWYPLTFQELGTRFDLESALSWGTLPGLLHLSSDIDRKRYLQSYAQTYIKEEILSEQVVRNIDPFRYFLEVAGQCNGQILNYSRISRDPGVDKCLSNNSALWYQRQRLMTVAAISTCRQTNLYKHSYCLVSPLCF